MFLEFYLRTNWRLTMMRKYYDRLQTPLQRLPPETKRDFH
jgi:hypothetical protein